MAVYLEVNDNGVYKYPYVNLPVSNTFTTKEINLTQFQINGAPVNLSNVTMVTFQIDKGSNPSLQNVDFSVRNTVIISNSVGIGENNSNVKEYSLAQNYPNPFNPETNIAFVLPQAAHVTLSVGDVLGRTVAVPLNEWCAAGPHSIRFSALLPPIPSGIYFYTLTDGRSSAVKRMVILK